MKPRYMRIAEMSKRMRSVVEVYRKDNPDTSLEDIFRSLQETFRHFESPGQGSAIAPVLQNTAH
ncbi:MAG: hypothetical protein N2C14_19640 [Planctomycetales bacterium]